MISGCPLQSFERKALTVSLPDRVRASWLDHDNGSGSPVLRGQLSADVRSSVEYERRFYVDQLVDPRETNGSHDPTWGLSFESPRRVGTEDVQQAARVGEGQTTRLPPGQLHDFVGRESIPSDSTCISKTLLDQVSETPPRTDQGPTLQFLEHDVRAGQQTESQSEARWNRHLALGSDSHFGIPMF